MMRQKALWMAVGGMTVLFLGQGVRAGTVAVGTHPAPHVLASSHGVGIGVWIGGPACEPLVRERVIVTTPPHRRFVPHWRPHREVVVVRPPVVIRHEPKVIVGCPVPVIESGVVDVWITNSNGSQTSVRLTRQGTWYIGPRGEWYPTMPTNEQLRVIYGF
jgi:hypothetical protein